MVPAHFAHIKLKEGKRGDVLYEQTKTACFKRAYRA